MANSILESSRLDIFSHVGREACFHPLSSLTRTYVKLSVDMCGSGRVKRGCLSFWFHMPEFRAEHDRRSRLARPLIDRVVEVDVRGTPFDSCILFSVDSIMDLSDHGGKRLDEAGR